MRTLLLALPWALSACSPDLVVPPDDAGNTAFVLTALDAVQGRGPLGEAEVDGLLAVLRDHGREGVLDALLADGGFVAYWTQVLADDLGLDRTRDELDACLSDPMLDPSDWPALAAHLAEAEVDDPLRIDGVPTPFNLVDALSAAIDADRLDLAYMAALPVIRMPHNTDQEGARDHWMSTYLARDLACLECHSSTWATVEAKPSNGYFDRHHPPDWFGDGHNVDLEGSVFSFEDGGERQYAGHGHSRLPARLAQFFDEDGLADASVTPDPSPFGLDASCTSFGASWLGYTTRDGGVASFAGQAGTHLGVRELAALAPRAAAGAALSPPSTSPWTDETYHPFGSRSVTLTGQGREPASDPYDGFEGLSCSTGGCHCTCTFPEPTPRDWIGGCSCGLGGNAAPPLDLALQTITPSRLKQIIETGSGSMPALALDVGALRAQGLGAAAPPLADHEAIDHTYEVAWSLLKANPDWRAPREFAPTEALRGYKILLAQRIVDNVHDELVGAPLLMEHGFPRNPSAAAVLADKVAFLDRVGFSLRDLVREMLLTDLANRRAPGADLDGSVLPPLGDAAEVAASADDPASFAPLGDPMGVDDPMADGAPPCGVERPVHAPTTGNRLGDFVHLRSAVERMTRVHGALGWPAPSVRRDEGFPTNAHMDRFGRPERFGDHRERDATLEVQVYWDEHLSQCAKPRARPGDVQLERSPSAPLAVGADWVDYVDVLVESASAEGQTRQVAVEALRRRLLGSAELSHDERVAIEGIFGSKRPRSSLDETVSPGDESSFRLVCGVMMLSPQFQLNGLAPLGPERAAAWEPCFDQGAFDGHAAAPRCTADDFAAHYLAFVPSLELDAPLEPLF